MIYLHKILPALFSPYSLFFFCIIVGLVKRKYAIIWTALIVLMTLSTPVVSSFLFAQLEAVGSRKTPADMLPADAIVVLSGMTHSIRTEKGIISEWNDPDRFFGGMELIKAKKAPVIIFTKGKLPWKIGPPESELLQETAIQMGVQTQQILVTGEVETTEDESREVKKILESKGNRIILVTSAFHMRRAKITFDNKGLEVQSYPVDFKLGEYAMTPMDFIPNPLSLATTEKCVRELIGTVYYTLKAFVKG
jgi:uncharacterized SAM-binding protein YcdF (DUF218 family)